MSSEPLLVARGRQQRRWAWNRSRRQCPSAVHGNEDDGNAVVSDGGAAGTASVNLAAASRVRGSTVAEAASVTHSGVLRAGHPSGVMQAPVQSDRPHDDAAPRFSVLEISRTSRRLADARVYVPE
ncbi:MAG: methylitaconate Delta-isomerase [Pseudonocardiales bacterium]|jgi:hypothetical protein|nr:methylitaconate Delta-isomerase [Pseudonocardiales bacterium]